jgi:hypothetical protein
VGRRRGYPVLVALLALVAAIGIGLVDVGATSDDDASVMDVATSEAVDALRDGNDPDDAIGRVFHSYEHSFTAREYSLLAEAGRDAIESGELRSEYVDDVDENDRSTAAFTGFLAIVHAAADEAGIPHPDR